MNASAANNDQGKPNLILTGFMGTGKTSVGSEVARRIGREFVDMDQVIEQRSGRRISDIFATQGEAAFRRLEADLSQELGRRSGLVIATGGGALLDAHSREALERSGLIICLDCSEQEIVRRLANAHDRPLLSAANPSERIALLLQERRSLYESLPIHVSTDALSVDETVERALELYERWEGGTCCQQSPLEGAAPLIVQSPGGPYAIHLESGVLSRAGAVVREALTSRRLAVVSNPTVAGYHGQTLEGSLQAAGLDYQLTLIPDGEQYKTLDTVKDLYERFLAYGLDRGDGVLAFGGGVVGDVAGFAAATYMRGLPLVQVPTTLLSMVDSSVGGKTGVDLPQGKNLVGAFKHPTLVVADPQVLQTLPTAELRSGLAEVIKAAVIGAPDLFDYLETWAHAQPGIGERPEFLWDWSWIIRRALEVKVAVVEADPHEQGRRAVLNFGHTVGHALELLSGYQLRHGEAVGMGMVVACRLSQALGHCDQSLVVRLVNVLRALGLPVELPGWHTSQVWQAMQSDKKRRGQTLRWILPRDMGDMVASDAVPRDAVLRALVSLGCQR